MIRLFKTYQFDLNFKSLLFCLLGEDRTPAKSLPPRRRGWDLKKLKNSTLMVCHDNIPNK